MNKEELVLITAAISDKALEDERYLKLLEEITSSFEEVDTDV